MISKNIRERENMREYSFKDSNYEDYYFRYTKENKSKKSSGHWEEYGLKYLRNTETGQLVRKDKLSKVIEELFIERL